MTAKGTLFIQIFITANFSSQQATLSFFFFFGSFSELLLTNNKQIFLKQI